MSSDIAHLPRLMRDLTEPEPIPAAGIARAVELMQSGRLFRYGEMGADQLDVSLLEQEFAAFVGRDFCVAVNSGGGAIFLALKLLDVQPGEPVLVNGFTLAPVPGAIVHAGAKPVIVEIGANYVIDLADLRRKAQATGARVLLLSHMRGHLADMDAITDICAELGLKLIEDCAHSLCATWNGQTIGTFGEIGCFSAQTYKHLNAGEGGFLVLDDADMTARAILHSGSYMLHAQHLSTPGADVLAKHGQSSANFSMRMTALAAAMLRPQLKELPRRAARWNVIHDRISAGLSRSQAVWLPKRPVKEGYSATSVQFSLLGFDAAETQAFLARTKARGLPIKWFGAETQVGFTSAPRHWNYTGQQGDLAQTHEVLAGLCDIRTPVSMTDDECDLAAEIVREAIQSVISARPGTGKAGQSEATRKWAS
ncbi:MAG: DegT/DnrJ/EryC1/StrS family aminotransferase [Bosea sp. (in: a-proteobacteria)]